MRYLKLVPLGLMIAALSYAQEPEGVSGSEIAAAKSDRVISEPDFHVLKRQRSFRGPYTDQDDPLLLAEQSKENARTGVNPNELSCRPPHCSREDARLIIKLATPASAQALAKATGNSSKQSAYFVDTSLTPIFSQSQVTKARAKLASTRAKMPLNSMGKPVDLMRWRSLALPAGTDLDEAIADLSLDPRVEVVESSFERQLKGELSKPGEDSSMSGLAVAANDPRKGEQWALERTRTEDAWQWLEDNGYPAWGDRNIVVAVIDSGVDYTHEDLAGNMWVNAGEIPDNGIDDDNNGFVDDVYGADVVGSEYDHDGDPQDDNGHGTHVAGIIAAQGNNDIGIIGVAPNAQIMAIKAAQYSGVLTSTDISEAILYAYQQGADIINMSFGGSGRSILEEEALAVAFSNAVLVAAAGNQGTYNERLCGLRPLAIYPGSYPYVLGVMAEAQSAKSNGDWLASFSNWDCKAKNSIEYEVMAPGVDVLSTIPGDGYAAWDGTSMAAPVVSGMAALTRTRFDDKAVYSSRFIMGQLASTGASKQGKTPCIGCPSISYSSADALSALTDVPNPAVSYLEHYLWDSLDQGEDNDDDGIVDAGETIELGIVVKNYWGQGSNVTVTLSAQADGAVNPDPYITFDVNSVNYGSVGSFAEDDNGFVIDNSGLVTDVENPFRFTVSPSTPNDHVIPMVVTITAENGLDPTDTQTYSTASRFNLKVQRGRSLPSIIASDAEGTPGGNIDTDGIVDGIVTLDDSNLWLIDQPTLVAEGSELRITSGAIVQWSPETSSKVYGEVRAPYLQVEGQLTVVGSEDDPVIFQPSPLYPRWAVVIFNPANDINRLTYSYARIHNLWMMASLDNGWNNRNVVPTGIFEHTELIRSDQCLLVASVSDTRTECGELLGTIQLSKSKVKWRTTSDAYYYALGHYFYYPQPSTFDEVLFNNSDLYLSPGLDRFGEGFATFENSVVLDSRSAANNAGRPGIMAAPNSTVTNNAFLNPVFETDLSKWFRVRTTTEHNGSSVPLASNYWGSNSNEVAALTVFDQADDFNLALADLDPILSEPAESTYPMVTAVEVLDSDGNARAGNLFSAESTNWRVTFNRDMDTETLPFVTYGPDLPYTDFSVTGDWVDARTWEGSVAISPVATDGYQIIRISGARAADDKWLDIGVDQKRFRFEVSTSGAESLNLQASGGEGYIDLSWNQDDYDTLMGFNIYRSTSQDGNYVRINQTLVGNEDREYRDSNTEPGVQYFYYFTVALDGSESEPSNKASATPIDTVKPVMSHNIISTATYGSTVMVQANVTDNISVQSVTLYYRAIGDTSYTSADMVNTSGSTYRASIPASATQPPGVEYYIAATDGSSYTYSGRASSPNKITIENNPVVTSVSPSAGSTAGGEVITVSGNNFVDGATVALGSATCQNVVWASESRLTCTTPASAPNLVAVTVENPDGGKGVLTSAFTFVGNSTTMALPDITASQGQTRDVALTVDPVSGMQSFTAVISWNGDHLQYAGFTKGALVSGWDVVSQLEGTTLTIAGSSSTSVSGSGELVLLEFGVVADGDASSVIDLVSAQINEGYIETALVDGSFTTAAGFSISGQVRFWDASNTAVAATVTLDNTLEEVSDEATGQFQFSGVLDGTHTLNIEKEDGINDSIRGYDASLILSHVVGSATLTGSALAAADVTGNGEISALDASKVLEVAAGLETVPFANQASPWTFEPAERRYDEVTSNITDADFTAIYMGDVSGNWGELSTQSLTGVRLELDSITRDGIATVNVLAAPPVEGAAISSVELTLNTTAGVSLIQASRTPATTNWSEPLVTVGDNVFSTIIYDDVSGAFSTETHVLSLELSLTNGQQAVTSMGGWLNEMQLYSSEAFALKSANDTDGDFVDDDEDAFPNDPAASTDTDGDGMPDDWNPGYTARDSESGLVLDLDDDNDGYSDKEEEEAGTDSLNAADQPISGMSILLIKQAIDSAAARSQQ